jgi:hypothetical protein
MVAVDGFVACVQHGNDVAHDYHGSEGSSWKGTDEGSRWKGTDEGSSWKGTDEGSSRCEGLTADVRAADGRRALMNGTGEGRR